MENPRETSPHVSVVMPACNAERTIVEAAQSVLQQTFKSLELIICDDASSDGTMARLTNLQDPRLVVIRNSRNEGAGPSRDKAISKAQGHWLAFIDADDSWAFDRLETLLEVAGDTGAMVFDDILQCHDSDAGMVPWKPLRGSTGLGRSKKAVREVAFEEFIAQERLLIQPILPREIVCANGIRHPQLKFGEDIHFLLHVLSTGLPIRYVSRAMYYYRLTPGSASGAPDKHRLMRESIESAQRFSWPTLSARAALALKLEALRKAEMYAEFKQAVSRREFIAAIRMLLIHPWIPFRALRRIWRATKYKMHRAWHGARGRDSSI